MQQDELDRARRILAKNARRVIQLEEQKKRMTGTTSDGAQASEAPEKDGGEMSDNETLAFQIGFNSIEYVTGSGTVTVSRQGTKTVTLLANNLLACVVPRRCEEAIMPCAFVQRTRPFPSSKRRFEPDPRVTSDALGNRF